MRFDNAIEVDHLQKRYGSKTAVHDLSFGVRRGETVAVLGPNGAGKSTTMEILEGYRDRSGGEVSVLGVDPRKGALDWKARLGIVLQSSEESPRANVREFLVHVARFYPRPRKVDAVLAAVGLEAKANARIGSLSGGQRRRLDVALAIVGRPELLFLDEPTTGFDPESRQQFWDVIRGLQDEGTTILLTTHYLDEAAQLSDRIAVVDTGRLIAYDRTADFSRHGGGISEVRWHDARGEHQVRTHDAAGFVRSLMGGGDGVEIGALAVTPPSLEDIYLDLIGQRELIADDGYELVAGLLWQDGVMA